MFIKTRRRAWRNATRDEQRGEQRLIGLPLVHLRRLLYRFPVVATNNRQASSTMTLSPLQPPRPRRHSWNRRATQILVALVGSVIIADGLVGDRGLPAMLRARQEHDHLAAAIARTRADNA